jgi:cytochrome c1
MEGLVRVARPLVQVALGAAVLGAACVGAGTSPEPAGRTTAQSAPARLTPAPNVPGDPERGRLLIVAAGCGGCHTIAGVPGATGVAGPNITNVVLRPTISGTGMAYTPDTLTQWLLDPQAVKPGAGMPSVGLSEAEARDIAAFLYSQPYNPGR